MSQARPDELILTDLDRELLQQCRTESFYKRSLPFSAALCAAVLWRHTQGHYQRWVAIRYIVAAVSGNILGRLSYMNRCREKFLNADDESSAIKATMLKTQKQKQQETERRDISLDSAPLTGLAQPQRPDNLYGQPSSPNSQQDSPYRQTDDAYRPPDDEFARYRPSAGYQEEPRRIWDDDFPRKSD